MRAVSLGSRLSICAAGFSLTPADASAALPAAVAKQLTVLNVFNKTHIPVTSARRESIAAASPASADGVVSKLAFATSSLSSYSAQFKRRVFNTKANTIVGEVHTVNKLITRALIESCSVASQQMLASIRTGALAARCVSGQ